MKMFWFTEEDCHDDMIAEAESLDELQKAMILAHNIQVEEDKECTGRSDYRKVKNFVKTKYSIDDELNEKEIKNFGEEVIFDAKSYVDMIRKDYNLPGKTIDELIEISFHKMSQV